MTAGVIPGVAFSTSKRYSISGVTTAVILFCILVFASFTRFSWLDWDHGLHLHPDERFLTIVASSLSMPDGLANYFDAENSSLNPRNQGHQPYVYGDLPLLLVRFVAENLDSICASSNYKFCSSATESTKITWSSYDKIYIVGRVISGLANFGTLIWIFLLSLRIFGRTEALVSLGFGASCVLFIQQSHFFTVDSLALFFATGGLYFLCSATVNSKMRNLIWAGILLGISIACRINLAPLLIFGLLASLERRSGSFSPARWIARTLVMILFAVIAFRLAMPTAFQSWISLDSRWVDDIRVVINLGSNSLYPPGVQWANRTPWLFPFKDILFWGMGIGLGLAAVCAWFCIGYKFYRAWVNLDTSNAKMADQIGLPVLLIWLWTGGYFAWVGSWPNPTMRYFMPIYPSLIILAGWLLVEIWRGSVWMSSRKLVKAIVLLTAILSIYWTLAFISIYRTPNPRITSAQWINNNIPAESTLGFEIWDDALRLSDSKNYDTISFNHYDEDRAEKLPRLITWLDQVDYIVLTSNRIHASIPRQPLRYPLASSYYRLLFSGDLGFTPVAEFRSYPTLFNIEFPDQEPGFSKKFYPAISSPGKGAIASIDFPAADEAFSVYDHARVLIFKKENGFDTASLLTAFGNVDFRSGLQWISPGAESKAPTALMFPDRDFDRTRNSGTWKALFDRGKWHNLKPFASVVMVYLFVSLVGWVMWPMAFRVFSGLADRGVVMARVFGILFASAGVWFLASLELIRFSTSGILLCLAVTGGVSLLSAWPIRNDLLAHLRSHGKLIVVAEIVFMIAFLGALTLRWFNPDLWHHWYGGEKPMDFAYLNAVLKSDYFPPHDPFFSGGYINYYYFGFVMAALPIKLFGIVPDVGYQISLAMFYALAACGVFSVAYSLGARSSDPLKVSTLAVILVLLSGNLVEVKILFQRIMDLLSSVSGSLNYPGHEWFWNATRVISVPNGEPTPITEFPFFTLLYGDLHAHFMTLPLTILVLGLSLSWWRSPPLLVSGSGDCLKNVCFLALGGVMAGSLMMSNTWDFPTYAGLALVALVAGIQQQKSVQKRRAILFGTLAFILAILLFTMPFREQFATGYNSFQLWRGSRTRIIDYLLIHGLFLFPIGLQLWSRVMDSVPILLPEKFREKIFSRVIFWFPVCLVVFLVFVFSVQVLPIFLVVIPIGLIALGLILNCCLNIEERAWAALVLLGALITLGVEVISLASDHGRSNTVFKFYYQVWVLWGICAAVAVGYIWNRNQRQWRNKIWRTILVLSGIAGITYTFLATPARLIERMDSSQPFGLNGSNYMRGGMHWENGQAINLNWDYQAIHWIQNNVVGTPVIAEGRSAHEYLWGNRIAINTGLPAVIGWRYHVTQSRSILPAEVVNNRITDLDQFFRNPEEQQALEFIHKYKVGLIYVGPLERLYYSDNGLEKFDAMVKSGNLKIVYQNFKVVIYEVVSG